jgi:hypothetical protein
MGVTVKLADAYWVVMFVVRYTVYFAPGNVTPVEISVGALTLNDPVIDNPFGATLQMGV